MEAWIVSWLWSISTANGQFSVWLPFLIDMEARGNWACMRRGEMVGESEGVKREGGGRGGGRREREGRERERSEEGGKKKMKGGRKEGRREEG